MPSAREPSGAIDRWRSGDSGASAVFCATSVIGADQIPASLHTTRGSAAVPVIVAPAAGTLRVTFAPVASRTIASSPVVGSAHATQVASGIKVTGPAHGKATSAVAL